MAQVEVRPLSDVLGAEVLGVDLSAPFDMETVAALRAAWRDHMVIVVRGQEVAPADQIRFCTTFGPAGKRARPAETRPETTQEKPPEVMFVSNLKENGKLIGELPYGEMQFHIDQSYTAEPAAGAALYAIEIPEQGGDTLFANLYRAYETLPQDLKALIAGRKAFNVFQYEATTRVQVERSNIDAGGCWHPIVRTHPESGRKGLFVNRLMTAAIEGLGDAEGREILSRLFDHLERPEFVYAHRWRRQDLLLWDNRCTAHARTDFDPAERRHLRRFTVGGTRPV